MSLFDSPFLSEQMNFAILSSDGICAYVWEYKDTQSKYLLTKKELYSGLIEGDIALCEMYLLPYLICNY